MPFRGALLDLDNTLYDYEEAHKPALKASVEWLSGKLSLPNDTVSGAYREARSQINEQLKGLGASHSRLLYFQRLNEILGFNPCHTALDAEELYWSVFLKHMQFRPGAVEFLDSLKGIVAIAIVTDLTAQIQLRKLNHLGLDKHIAALVTSEESGAEKPDAQIFDLALKKLGLTRSDACVIGDNWEKDILGAMSLGMRSFWLKPDEYNDASDRGDGLVAEFKTFDELARLIGTY